MEYKPALLTRGVRQRPIGRSVVSGVDLGGRRNNPLSRQIGSRADQSVKIMTGIVAMDRLSSEVDDFKRRYSNRVARMDAYSFLLLSKIVLFAGVDELASSSESKNLGIRFDTGRVSPADYRSE